MVRSIKINALRLILTLSFTALPIQLNADELVIGVETINYYPYYRHENDLYQGFAADLFNEFGKQYNHTIVFRPLPIQRLYQELLSQSIDFKFPDHPLWGAKQKGDGQIIYSQPIVGFIDGLLVLPKNEQQPTFDHIGYVRGFSPWPLMDLINSGKMKSREVNSLKSLLNMTLNQRVQGAYFNVAVANYLLEHELDRQGALVQSSQFPGDKSNYRASSLSKKTALKQFNQFLDSENAKKIYQKYNLSVYQEDQ